MPNQAHVALLLAGIENWNEWVRQQRISRQYGTTRHAGAKIGVSSFYADLRKADLSGADLYQGKAGAGRTGADLIGADLRGANLRGAKLGWANLTGATLANADLSGATLMNSRLDGANLSGADLSDATLGGANLLQANLSGATLNNTYLYHTDFSDTNLDRAIGLETCRYAGPCTIDHRTMFEYEPLPISFLRGCGLPESLVDYLPSLRGNPIQYYTCFISFSTADQLFANRLRADLQDRGVRSWFAPHDLPVGAKTWDAIDEAIRLRDKLLLVLSAAAIASDWVEDEVNKAFAEERERKTTVLFPIRIDDSVMTATEPWARKLRDQRNIGDFLKWREAEDYNKGLNRILRDLKVIPAAAEQKKPGAQ
jgi:uncharacterized protein YjbI with pentapeptide repeats